ncbi:MAG: hypothetical protein HQL64_07130 [Magnetococcales bacterium]|nr:hypothetical protein [Magnetococcales bacterium]
MHDGDIIRSLTSGLYQVNGEHGLNVTPHPVRATVKDRIKYFINSIHGYNWLLTHSHAIQFMRTSSFIDGILQAWTKNPGNKAMNEPPVQFEQNASEYCVRLGNALFLRLKNWTSQRGIPLLVLANGFFDSDRVVGYSGQFYQQSRTFFKKIDVAYADLYPEVEGSSPMPGSAALRIPNEGHPTELGADLVGRASWKFVEEHLLSKVLAGVQ